MFGYQRRRRDAEERQQLLAAIAGMQQQLGRLIDAMKTAPPDPSGTAALVQAITGAEVERIKATADDRKRADELREVRREKDREWRSTAGKKGAQKRWGKGEEKSPCRVCQGSAQITPPEVERHYAEGHPMATVSLNGGQSS